MEQDNSTNAGIEQESTVEDKSSVGPTVAIIIIVALIALGGIYAWKNFKRNPPPANLETAQTASEEAAVMEAELNKIDTNANQELNNLEKGL